MCLYITSLVAWIHSGEVAIKAAIKMGHKETNPLKQISQISVIINNPVP